MVKQALNGAKNLLAVIHKDGGHYLEAHGWEKACEDAILEVYSMRQEISELRAMAEQAQEIGVSEGLFDAEESVLPWQDFDETVKRLEGSRDDS
jgi:hypothetical protein